jgi:hypothetical protein
MNHDRATGNHHDRGKVERVKRDPGDTLRPFIALSGKPKA